MEVEMYFLERDGGGDVFFGERWRWRCIFVCFLDNF